MSQQKMTNACRLLTDHLQNLPIEEPLYQELRFLRAELSAMLLDKGNQEDLYCDFERQSQLEVKNPWLKELTERYFQ